MRRAVRHERAQRIAKVSRRAGPSGPSGMKLRPLRAPEVATRVSSGSLRSMAVGAGGAPTMADAVQRRRRRRRRQHRGRPSRRVLARGRPRLSRPLYIARAPSSPSKVDIDDSHTRTEYERAIDVGNGETAASGPDAQFEKASTVTDHELSDPSELAAKRAGAHRLHAPSPVPLFYLVYTAVILSNGCTTTTTTGT